ncbi:MAG: S-ribosylhomocysteine lyase [candidate division Zixibacteria bacterium]|nr:S-ribosylhomocysteine lyase [candidate division Zixibacteria bacterium]
MNKNTKNKVIPESFSINHSVMPAPQVRKAGLLSGPGGDKLSKFDLRFLKPNVEAMPTAAIHTLEHLLAMFLRENLENIIDLSPMGCRTGFYLTVWGDVVIKDVQDALCKSLEQVLKIKHSDVPGLSEKECGNYRDHSLFSAKEYARKVLEGFKK